MLGCSTRRSFFSKSIVASSLFISAIRSGPGFANVPFASWLEAFRKRASSEGVAQSTIQNALSNLEPDPKVVELDARQPESRLTFVEYKKRVVSRSRIDSGREKLGRYSSLLERTEREFGVPPEILVSLWGIESSFGEYKGRFSVVRSLATLAHDGRRADFFEDELIAALKIIDAGDVEIDSMYGSWAGAMGQSQFMPSTFLQHAVDVDGDGRRNIWNSLDDTFGSMANYLRAIGWDSRYIWGREVSLTRKVDASLGGRDKKLPLSRWQGLGVRRIDGRNLPDASIDAALIMTDDGAGPTYLTYQNFDVLMKWNRSTYFALSVGLLADKFRSS